MIRTCALTTAGVIKYDLSLRSLKKPDIVWYWVDFDQPSNEESQLLSKHFRFHPLAIEDCLEFVQRPKMDFFDKYVFIVMHYLNQKTLSPEEVDVFVGSNYIVTFHKKSVRGLNNTWARVRKDTALQQGPMTILHAVMDQLVDDYFPPIYRIEDRLNEIEEDTDSDSSVSDIMDEVFDIRSDLSKMRRTVLPMRDLLYRILNSERIAHVNDQKIYFQDIYDHLLKITELIEANREFTSDIRDNYISINSDRMNSIMMTLTVITTIFMPLSFIAGLYGMNFTNMPELRGHYNYFIVLAVMVLISIGMTLWFKKKGWFRFSKRSKL
ncbi:magnesium/cobalt transporter CorA [Priestia koreensis]|uniref:magnesium/cobalt transporter CorA n=1 Tax=Priestia koreensis TaxID=284581 RepID=UPI001F59BB36|nr:magnesium/cobalt transporter CorA [Priestia koreensis]UNL85932.1 magnesium/cobalt transporter CorA [Priestia koreensis]